MPKVVDHDARRAEIAEALWRVLHRDGIRAVSVRTVAAEAGWSPGALRYYFPDQVGLLRAAMQLVIRRATERVERIQSTGPIHDVAIQYLEQVIPLDAERRTEFEVWLALTAEARVRPELTEHLVEANDGVHRLCRRLIDGLAEAGQLGAGRDPAREAARLHALVDGLALHSTTPRRLDPSEVRGALRTHLADLAAPLASA